VAVLVDMVPVGNILCEGPLWSVRDARLWWTDIQGRLLFRYDPVTRTLDKIAAPERLCSFAFVAGSGRLIAAFESGLTLYDPASGAVEWLYRLERGTAPIRFNDGRTDRQGRFLAGTMVEGDGREPLGRPHCVDRHGRVTRDGLKDDMLLSQPSAGNLFVYRTDITGLPDADFIFEQAN
jgi:sugar lactone lactonase YvrE